MPIEFRITVEHVADLQQELELLLKGLVKPLVEAPAAPVAQTKPEPKAVEETPPHTPLTPAEVTHIKKGKSVAKGNGAGEAEINPVLQKAKDLMAQYSARFGIDPAVTDLREALSRRFKGKKYIKLADVPEADLPTVVLDIEKMIKSNPFKRNEAPK